jgi:hypothetical protein
MPDARCTRGLVCTFIGRTHTSNNEYTGITRHSPRNGFNGFLRALVSAKSARMCERAVLTNRPSLERRWRAAPALSPADHRSTSKTQLLPGDHACLPPSPTDMFLSKPGWADLNSANLTPASGRQDHTTSPYAATSLVRVLLTAHGFKEPALRSRRAQNAAASTASAPRVRDDRDTPLLWGGMRKVLEVIWGEWEQKYFSENQK